jgi:hypothetical protein
MNLASVRAYVRRRAVRHWNSATVVAPPPSMWFIGPSFVRHCTLSSRLFVFGSSPPLCLFLACAAPALRYIIPAPPHTIPALRRGRALPSLCGTHHERYVPSEIGYATNAIVVQWCKIQDNWDQWLDVEDGHGRNHMFNNHLKRTTLFSSILLCLVMYNSTITYCFMVVLQKKQWSRH